MKYRKIQPSRWYHLVQYAIGVATGQMIASGEADRATEKWLQRSRLMRRDTWRRCAESRHNMRRGGE